MSKIQFLTKSSNNNLARFIGYKTDQNLRNMASRNPNKYLHLRLGFESLCNMKKSEKIDIELYVKKVLENDMTRIINYVALAGQEVLSDRVAKGEDKTDIFNSFRQANGKKETID